jgi:hypothetical protein
MAPKVLLGTVLWRKFYFGIEAGWLLQLGQSTTIKLTQYDESDDSNSNPVGKVHLNANGSPGGPEVALNVGWCFGGPPFFLFLLFHRWRRNLCRSARVYPHRLIDRLLNPSADTQTG